MTYNIHPLLVHFPIAFLFIYSIIRILFPVHKPDQKTPWKQIGKFLLLIGILGAILAISTGGVAEFFSEATEEFIEKHEMFANATLYIYIILAFGEFMHPINKLLSKVLPGNIMKTITSLQKILTQKWVMYALLITGITTLTLTGVLGGVMVHGLEADPMAPFILKTLNLTI